MKKSLSVTRPNFLRLRKESIRVLTTPDLARVHGGEEELPETLDPLELKRTRPHPTAE